MSFRSHRSPKLSQTHYSSSFFPSSTLRSQSPQHSHPHPSNSRNPYPHHPHPSLKLIKKSSYQPCNLRTKQSIQDIIQTIGNRIKSTRSSKHKPSNNHHQQPLGLSRTSFFEETSILNYPKTPRYLPHPQPIVISSKLDQLYNELSSKQELITSLENENQCLKLLLGQEVKRMDEESYEKVAEQQREIEHLTKRVQQLRGRGCLSSSRSDCNEYELGLQDQIGEYEVKLKEMQGYRDELESIITKLYRENLGLGMSGELGTSRLSEGKSRFTEGRSRRGGGVSGKELGTRIKECIGMLDELVR